MLDLLRMSLNNKTMNELTIQAELELALIKEIRKHDCKLAFYISLLLDPVGDEMFENILDDIEEYMLKKERCGLSEMDMVDMNWEHSDGVSMKKMEASRGFLIMGKKHKKKHLTHMVRGSVLMFSSSGPFVVNSPSLFESEIGTRKLGICIDDMEVYNILPNPSNLRNEDELDQLFTDSDPILEAHKEKLENGSSEDEYALLLEMLGIDESAVQASMLTQPKPIDCLDVDESFAIRESKIHGSGMIAIRDIDMGEVFSVIICGDRTNLARFTNHSFTPNLECELDGDDMIAIANCKIKEGEEVSMNYFNNMNLSKERELCLQH